MNYINIGKKEGATVHLGGERHGTEGYFIQPTIFTDVTPDMTIVKEEIFGPGTSHPFSPSSSYDYMTLLMDERSRENNNISCGGGQVPRPR